MLSGRKLLLEIFHMFRFWFFVYGQTTKITLFYDKRKEIDVLYSWQKGERSILGQVKPNFFNVMNDELNIHILLNLLFALIASTAGSLRCDAY